MTDTVPDFLIVCTGPTCGERGGTQLLGRLKKILVENGDWDRCRVVPANCFGECATGPNGCNLGRGRFLSGLDPEQTDESLERLLGDEEHDS